jgi:predicted house-cleaning noncanonical NTP pyrophosphatase (MazG superfamily)
MPSSPRITVSLDIFDDKVINKMSEYRDTSKSEIVRNIIHQWIEESPDLLEKNYGISFKEINKEIKLETSDKTMEDLKEKLLSMKEMLKRMSIEDLADILEVDQKTAKKLIFNHGPELKEKGLILQYDNGIIERVSD